MPNETFYVRIDAQTFKAEVQRYLDLSPVTKEWTDVKLLKWPGALMPPALWTTIRELTEMISVVVSAVELAKQKIIKEHDPDGSKGAKFDREIALSTAVEILGTLIRFEGWLGVLVNRMWKPLLNLMVSIYVNGLPAGDWVQIAIAILKIAASVS